ncbi:MAG: beta-ketoacyl-[acyl-carrier-protein] synthase family protein [Acidipropionibacterium sp.]|jgi:3-oxoacyl-[acyl-carrier-protein] synthase II|nr:beta-ketoacyl-[acyl-carrier-protein] synthase family protein [Acidipropionibacterium sp.]
MQISITGYGAVTSFGLGVDALWSGLLEGRSGARDLEGPVWEGLPVRIAAPVTADLEAELGHPKARQLDRSQQLALIAAAEAWRDAGSPEVEPERLAVAVGTGIGGVNTLLGQDDVLESRGARRVSPRAVPMLMPNGAAAQLSIEYGAKAGAFTPVSACASGAEAITMAARLIACDEADVVIAGGTESAVVPLTMASFAQATALARPDGDPATVSRPFSADRRGFLLGEGAGIVILERADHAAARRARAHAELAGWAVTSDAYHITATEPSGAQQVRAIRGSLRRAGLSPSDVDHVNAHATGTPVGDLSEATAIEEVLGTGVSVTAPKSAIGHLFGGAGAVETIIAVKTIEDGVIPATLNLDEPDPQIHVDVVSGTPRRQEVRVALNNSFGFGGQNVTLALTK